MGSGPSSCPYAHNVVEDEFSEVRGYKIPPRGSAPRGIRLVTTTAKENQTYCSKLVRLSQGDADTDREGGPT